MEEGNLAYAGVGCMVVIVGGVLVPMIKLLPKGNLNIQTGAALYNAIDGTCLNTIITIIVSINTLNQQCFMIYYLVQLK